MIAPPRPWPGCARWWKSPPASPWWLSSSASEKGAEALTVEWSASPLDGATTASLRADYAEALAAGGKEAESTGDVAAALAGATKTVDLEFWAPFLAHAPMEPMSAVVHVKGDSAELWAGTWASGTAGGLVARHAGLEPAQVKVHQTYLGGALGAGARSPTWWKQRRSLRPRARPSSCSGPGRMTSAAASIAPPPSCGSAPGSTKKAA